MQIDYSKYLRKLGSHDYFSQACQDLFALNMLNNKSKGYYCEIGGAHPIESNNSFLLEHKFAWNGMSVEFDKNLCEIFNDNRKNPCIHADATIFNYENYFNKNNFPKQIDYLSVDIDPAQSSYLALERVPFDTYRFSVITYEHEKHLNGSEFVDRSREFLILKGYQLVVENVKCFGRDFEDWWIDPNIVPIEVWQKLEAKNIEFSDIFNK